MSEAKTALSGFFITLEGGEGTGKSTQIALLDQYLTSQGHQVVKTREPGGCETAEKIRELLVQGNLSWDPISELLLHYTARREHYVNVISPALEAGKVIICDRFADSTMAYQGYAMGVGRELCTQLHQMVLGDFQPHLTFVLDIDPKVGLARAKGRNDHDNRYENMDFALHQKIRDAFLDIAKRNPERCVVISAEQPIEAISHTIISQLETKLGARHAQKA